MRNRIIYQNVALMVGPAPAYSPHSGQGQDVMRRSSKLRTLNLIQNTNFGFNVNRNEISQIGGFTSVARKTTSQPDVTLSFSHILSDGKNEDTLGFCISGENSAFLSGTHQKDKDRNFFIAVTEKQEQDFITRDREQDFSNIDVISIGNCFPTAYSIQAAVGSFPTANLEYVGSNIKVEKPGNITGAASLSVSGIIPAVNPNDGQVASSADTHGYLIHSGHIASNPHDLTVGVGTMVPPTTPIGTLNSGDIHYLKPGDMELTLSQPDMPIALLSGSASTGNMHINSVSIGIPINRNNSQGFGSNYVTERKPNFPSVGSLSFSAVANNFKQDNLDDVFQKDEDYTFTITFKDPTSSTTKGELNKAIEIEVSKARLQSETVSLGIGGRMEVNANFAFECTPFTGFKFSGISSRVEPYPWR